MLCEDGSLQHHDEPTSVPPLVLREETALHPWALTHSCGTFIMGQACKERKMVPRDAQDEKVLVIQPCQTLCDSMDLQPTRLLCPWDFSRQQYWSGECLLSYPLLGIMHPNDEYTVNLQ